ncbi:MAG: hypothetical protein HY321_12310 [Armatimonadetes bacterium]|nr:hypothetical protein [Armatimonadota bacterium]
MENSRALVLQACAGVRPERTPLFDSLLNDAVIAHFAGRPLDGTDDAATVARAAGKALDVVCRMPLPDQAGRTWTDERGSRHVAGRWNDWTVAHGLQSPAEWAAWIARHIERYEAGTLPDAQSRAAAAAQQRAMDRRLDGALFVHCRPATALNAACYDHCGFETFSYLWMDYRDLVEHWLRALQSARRRCLALSAPTTACPLAVVYADIAFNHRLIFSPAMLAEVGFFDDLADICEQCHRYGLQVIFHSDGYLMEVLPDLVAAGIDGLNPIEAAAGMDIHAIRRRYPELILAGGVDAARLLPLASPGEVRRETRRIIQAVGSEGRLLIGSSAEVDDTIPLVNYLAFHEEAMRG